MPSIKGFTLVELMVTIAVASILLVIGAPSLTSLYETTRADQSIRKVQTIIAYARNQAISYNQVINLCPQANNVCGNDWKAGIQVFRPAQGGQAVAQLRYIEAFNDSDLIKFGFNQLQFTPDGRVSFLANGAASADTFSATLSYCPSDKNNEHSQSITINSGGGTQITKSGVNCNTSS
ncbi:methylation site containing protein [Shewanella sp. OPT22]|nr:methylation site containing protein [Shewanella sp. OPT22]